MSREEEQLEKESAADEQSAADAAGSSSVETDDVAVGGVELQNDADDAGANEFADAEDEDDGYEEDEDVIIHDADAEDAAEKLAVMRREMAERGEGVEASGDDGEVAPGGSRSMSELISIIESLIFVSEEPLPTKTLADVLKEDRGWVQVAVEELAKEFNERNGGLMLREVAGGWQFATRPENHEHVRAFLKSRPSAKLSLAALETLAVIAYKQPITVPEILEIRGVQSSSAIKTLLDKRLIISKGRKETVGRPMMYGTSKEFLLQFGLRDLSELPNVEDFEDLATGGA
ncbi:MAG TPA: SMC-Scp complex subunit ScpB [Pyrinomonadaceae bacterium]|nr:SMC-Scp complex subunit ScpB [Pyrinomonadaceae bacterium]